jgi:carbon storage regulator
MLILRRRVGETIHIGNDVTVRILGVKRNQVRVGTNAPAEAPVNRTEILERVAGQKNRVSSLTDVGVSQIAIDDLSTQAES